MVQGKFDAVLEKISGFHIYDLENKQRTDIGLSFVSESLCEMTGYEREELKENYEKIIYEKDREIFAKFIEELYDKGGKSSVKYRLVKKDKTILTVLDEVETAASKQVAYSVLVNITDTIKVYQEQQDREIGKYRQALSDVYDKIFEYNFATSMVKCLCSNDSPIFKTFENVPMQLEEATRQWIAQAVEEKDVERVTRFFENFKEDRRFGADITPPVLTYTARSSDGQMRMYRGIFLNLDKDVGLYCSRRFLEGETLEKINMESKKTEVSIRTFGYFDVFVGDKPIAFRNKKSKELFALLVDRRGGFVTSDEAIGFLWEDETVNPVTLSRYRKVALRLKNTLEAYGISDIVEAVDGKRRIIREKVSCDLYDYLTEQKEYANLFKGSYLTNYSWGEMTLAELCQL